MIAHIKLEGTAPASAQRDEVEKLHPSPVISALAHEEDTAAINDESTLLIKHRIKRKKTPNTQINYSSSQMYNIDFLH